MLLTANKKSLFADDPKVDGFIWSYKKSEIPWIYFILSVPNNFQISDL